MKSAGGASTSHPIWYRAAKASPLLHVHANYTSTLDSPSRSLPLFPYCQKLLQPPKRICKLIRHQTASVTNDSSSRFTLFPQLMCTGPSWVEALRRATGLMIHCNRTAPRIAVPSSKSVQLARYIDEGDDLDVEPLVFEGSCLQCTSLAIPISTNRLDVVSWCYETVS